MVFMRKVLLIFLALLLAACARTEQPLVRIGINPWPGYELLYLAQQLDLYKQAGLNVEIVQLSSLADTQRAFLQERIDGMASTLIEASVVASRSAQPLQIGLISDYSAGADVIIARHHIRNMQGLKGQVVGAELQSLGVVLLARALASNGMGFADIRLRNVEQADVLQAMASGDVQAVVSYPPESVKLLDKTGHHVVFSSTEIPNEIIDVVVFRTGRQVDAAWLQKFRAVWHQAYSYWQANPLEAVALMAKREGLSAQEFNQALAGMQVLDIQQQEALLAEGSGLLQTIVGTCDVLQNVVQMNIDCERVKNNLLIQGHE